MTEDHFMTTRLIQHHSHWGAFLAEVEDGRVVGVKPFARDPDRVREDVTSGRVSADRARDGYGVILTADGDVDQEATRRRRAW